MRFAVSRAVGGAISASGRRRALDQRIWEARNNRGKISMSASVRFATRREQKLILLLCVIAAVRVFTFSAAFPFFNNVDEQAHADLVMKYARGDVPRDLGHFSSESAYYFSLYGTPEYFTASQRFDTGKFTP